MQVHKRLVFLVSIILIISCNQPDELYPTPTITPTLPSITIGAMSTPQPRPDFINDVSPAESSLFSVDIYKAYLDMGAVYADVRTEETGHNNSVCINLDTGPLLEENDRMVDSDIVLDRMKVYVDGQELSDMNYILWYKTATCTVDFEPICNDPNLSHTTNAIGFDWITFCWTAEINAGIHKVLFQFLQTSGHIQEYSWEFALTNDSIPLATFTPPPLWANELRSDVPLCNDLSSDYGTYYTVGISVANILEECGKPDIIYQYLSPYRVVHMVYLQEGLEIEIIKSASFGFSSDVWSISRFPPVSEDAYRQEKGSLLGSDPAAELTWEEAFGN